MSRREKIKLIIKGSLKYFSYDGAEFRFLKELTRGWNVNIYDRHFLFDKGDTWDEVAEDVEHRRTMMGMCSMWLIEDKYRRLDLSHYFSHLCGTFLVPKPMQITQASYIYLPLNAGLWFMILGTLFATALLYFYMTQTVSDNHTVLENLTRSFLDVINIVTSHGLPKIIEKLSIRLLIISWMMLSLLLGTAYSTKYTSILTQPLYTKAVDTVKDFIEEGLFWGEVGDRESWKKEFLATGNEYYMELPNRMIEEKDLSERLEYIPKGHYARYVKILGNNYVTDTETFAPLANQLRLMKTCVDNYYTVFPFAKNSPYTAFVNRKIAQFTDAGIIDHWFNLMTIKYGKSYMAGLFDKNREKTSAETQSLVLNNVVGGFYLLGIGLTVSAVAFIFELYLYNRRQRVFPSPLEL